MKLQASYNDDANKIVEQATKEKNAIKYLKFLINLAMVTNHTKSTSEELQTFNDAWNHPNKDSCKNSKKGFAKNLQTWTSIKYGAWLVKVLCPQLQVSQKEVVLQN